MISAATPATAGAISFDLTGHGSGSASARRENDVTPNCLPFLPFLPFSRHKLMNAHECGMPISLTARCRRPAPELAALSRRAPPAPAQRSHQRTAKPALDASPVAAVHPGAKGETGRSSCAQQRADASPASIRLGGVVRTVARRARLGSARCPGICGYHSRYCKGHPGSG